MLALPCTAASSSASLCRAPSLAGLAWPAAVCRAQPSAGFCTERARTDLHGRHGPEACQGVVLGAAGQDDGVHLLADVIAGQLVDLAQRDRPLEALAGRGRQAAARCPSARPVRRAGAPPRCRERHATAAEAGQALPLPLQRLQLSQLLARACLGFAAGLVSVSCGRAYVKGGKAPTAGARWPRTGRARLPVSRARGSSCGAHGIHELNGPDCRQRAEPLLMPGPAGQQAWPARARPARRLPATHLPRLATLRARAPARRPLRRLCAASGGQPDTEAAHRAMPPGL